MILSPKAVVQSFINSNPYFCKKLRKAYECAVLLGIVNSQIYLFICMDPPVEYIVAKIPELIICR